MKHPRYNHNCTYIDLESWLSLHVHLLASLATPLMTTLCTHCSQAPLDQVASWMSKRDLPKWLLLLNTATRVCLYYIYWSNHYYHNSPVFLWWLKSSVFHYWALGLIMTCTVISSSMPYENINSSSLSSFPRQSMRRFSTWRPSAPTGEDLILSRNILLRSAMVCKLEI